MFGYFKRYLPTTLFARSLLILLFPVVLLQGIMTVVIIQRHFQDVTSMMAQQMAADIKVILDAEAPRETAHLMGYTWEPVRDAPAIAQRAFYDYTGYVADKTLRISSQAYISADFTVGGQVSLFVDHKSTPHMIVMERKRLTPTNVHQLFVNMLIFGAIFSLVAILYLKNQVRSITHLTSAVTAFGRGENVPYKPSGADEVRRAGHAFMAMRRRVERFVNQRTLLLSSISHDLRTPLTRLKLELSMLEGQVETKAMLSDLAHMEGLIKEILEFGKGVVTGQVEDVDISDLVHDRLLARGIDPSALVSTGDAPPVMAVRKLALTRAIDNILSNAQRYAQTIHVEVIARSSGVQVIFDDNGPGIPEQIREDVLQPFARGNTARTLDGSAGTGLGLAIVQDVAQAHGGAVTLEDSPLLGGLRVVFELPR